MSSFDQFHSSNLSYENEKSFNNRIKGDFYNIEEEFKEKLSTSSTNHSNSNISYRKTISDYEFIQQTNQQQCLGKGTYGTVKLVIDKNDNQKYAIKIMSKQQIFQYCTIDNLKKEIKNQKKMNHPNICQLYSYFEDDQNVYLVLEYAEQGNLFENLKNAKKFSEDITFRFFFQTCLGIDYLHKNNIIHRDLKPENLLIDGKGDIKLCDFGWSADKQNGDIKTTFCGTVDYLAPEMIQNLPHDHRVDIWCLGILLYELIHGYPPFKGETDNDKIQDILKNQEIQFSNYESQDIQDLIRSILQKQPCLRISMSEIFNHRWMKLNYEKRGIQIMDVLDQQNQNVLSTFRFQRLIQERQRMQNITKQIYNNEQTHQMVLQQIKSQNLQQTQENRQRRQKKRSESFIHKVFVAFGCVAREKQ